MKQNSRQLVRCRLLLRLHAEVSVCLNYSWLVLHGMLAFLDISNKLHAHKDVCLPTKRAR